MNSLELVLGCLLVCCLVATTVEYHRQTHHEIGEVVASAQVQEPENGKMPETGKFSDIDFVYPIAASQMVLLSSIYLETGSRTWWRDQTTRKATQPQCRTTLPAGDTDCNCPNWHAPAKLKAGQRNVLGMSL